MASCFRFPTGLIVVGSCLFLSACQYTSEPLNDRVVSAGELEQTASPYEPVYSDQSLTPHPQTDYTIAPTPPEQDPLHYYTNRTPIMIRRPSGYSSEELAQVAVWWTENDGYDWHRAGFFKSNQSSFPLIVDGDGDYGIRFAGASERVGGGGASTPQRLYHVDMEAPEIEVSVKPDLPVYHPGQTVTISWRNTDYHLIEQSARVGVVKDYGEQLGPLVELQRDLKDVGTISYTIPEDMRGDALRFRVEALDRAGNLAIAFSDSLGIVDEDEPRPKIDGDSAVFASVEPRLVNEPPVSDSGANQDNQFVLAGPTAVDDDAPSPAVLETEKTDVESRTTAFPSSEHFAMAVELIQSLGRDASRFALSMLTRRPIPEAQLAANEPQTVEVETNDTADSDDSGDQTLAFVKDALASANDLMRADLYEGDSGFEESSPVEDAVYGASAGDGVGEFIVVNPDADEATDGGAEWNGQPECQREEVGSPMASIAAHPAELTDSASAFDPTHGNGLWVPLPATLVQASGFVVVDGSHPWRALSDSRGSESAVWHLPEPRMYDALARMFEGQYSTDVAESASQRETAGDGTPVAGFATLSESRAD